MQKKGNNFTGSVTNGGIIIALVVTAAAAWFHKDAALEGVRPTASGAVYRGIAYHDVEARLWQDPFAAVEAKLASRSDGQPKCSDPSPVHCSALGNEIEKDEPPPTKPPTNKRKGTASAPAASPKNVDRELASKIPALRCAGTSDSHCGKLREELSKAKGSLSNTIVLIVMAPGAPYPEIAEFRRRLRYAVVAGLSHQGFRPEDADHIDYHVPRSASSAIPNFVPYEWFEGEADSSPSRILLLWVNEDALVPENKIDPVRGISSLLDELCLRETQACKAAKITDFPKKVAAIGPSASDALSKMDCAKTSLNGIGFYSYGVTEHKRNKNNCNIDFTITSDDVLADAIDKELELRGIDPRNAHIALIAEWDTSYGNQIVETMQTGFKCGTCENTIVRRYLRGLDGGLPPENKQKQKASDSATDATTEKVSAESEARAFDRFEGLGRYDYLRRLEDQLRERDSKLRSEPFGRGLRAIGVLGSDVFDKLLVLRALKPAFPNAVFFTTDYDASLQTASERPFTRNLVVASSYGSKLGETLQGKIPPFRSAYQTSAFIATQAALDKEVERELGMLTKGAQVFEMTAQGRLHEIARYGASIANDGPRGPLEAAFPDMSTTQKFAVSIDLLLVAALIAAFIFSWRRSVGKAATGGNQTTATVDGGPAEFPLIGAFLWFWLVVVAIAVIFWREIAEGMHDGGEGELIAVTEGVSVWPTIALRIFLIALAYLFVRRARRRLVANRKEIEKEMLLGSQGSESNKPNRLPILVYFEYWPSFFSPHSPTFLPLMPNGTLSREVGAAWRNYLQADDSAFRRAAIVSGILLISFAVLTYAFDGVAPIIRGPLARYLFWFTLAIEFFAVVFLTVYVADATAHCLAFINDLEYHPTEWPESATSQYVTRAQAAQSDETTKERTLKIINDEKDLLFIEMRTSCILPLVYMPFLLIALTIVERSNVFAAYAFSGVVALAEAAALLMVLLCAWAMSRDAERARAMAIDHLERAILDAKRGVYKLIKKDALEAMLEHTKGLSGGAFSPLWSQPIVTGLILPAIGVASRFLFETNWLSGIQ